MYHTPVLLSEIMALLDPRPGERVIDATIGDGGHSAGILERIGSTGRVLGLDASPESLRRVRTRLATDHPNLTLVQSNFRFLEAVARHEGFDRVDGILFDLGLASWQLDQPGLGLSFKRDEPLDMRLDPTEGESVRELLARVAPSKLEEILETYGDLPRSRPVVQRIIDARRAGHLRTTTDLVRAIGTKSPKLLAPIFQALRIAVNDELEALKAGLEQALMLFKPGGRLVVISYHSGEDRIVKQSFRTAVARGQGTLLTNRPVVPNQTEQRTNPRSRSAKLRALKTRTRP